MEGWIKLHRAFAKWEWSDEPFMVSLFIHLLLAASNRDTKWKGELVKRGQVIFGLNKWASKTGVSVQSLRTSLKKLESTGEINMKSTSKYTIITVCKYDKYQEVPKGVPTSKPTDDQQASNKRPTINQQHREKVKKEKKEKKKRTDTPDLEPVLTAEVDLDELF